jgi:Bacterial membrane protein YfhO
VRYFIATDYNDSYQLMLARPDRFRPVFSEAHVTVFENRSVLPRALFVPASSGAIEVISDEQVQLARLKESSFAPDRSVLLDRIPEDLAIAGANPHSAPVTQISWIETSEDESTLRVESGRPGILIWSQIFYPGWKVFVDGKESPLLRADYAFIGVSLGQGTHTVRFVFHPQSFQAGSWITALTGLMMMGMVTYGVVKR